MPEPAPRYRLSDIDPRAVYPLKALCDVFPTRSGKRLHSATAKRWAEAGKVAAFRRRLPGDQRDRWMISGAAVLDACRPAPAPGNPPPPESPSEWSARADRVGQAKPDRKGKPVVLSGKTCHPRAAAGGANRG